MPHHRSSLSHVTHVDLPREDPRVDILLDERPWGQFEQFTLNEPTTVKIITVGPGGRLSLQRHRLRDELWTVLDDTLTVTVGEQTWHAAREEKIWIPRGTLHRVAAPEGSTGGRFLEVAFGHFDEGDIERVSDDYDRA